MMFGGMNAGEAPDPRHHKTAWSIRFTQSGQGVLGFPKRKSRARSQRFFSFQTPENRVLRARLFKNKLVFPAFWKRLNFPSADDTLSDLHAIQHSLKKEARVRFFRLE
jgi:hypothetical protein